MKRAVCAGLFLLVCAHPAIAAFEVLRAASSPAGFDPLLPSLHFWQRAPARLFDVAPRVHLAGAQPYGLRELSTAAVNVTCRPGNFGLGFSFATLGASDYYREQLAATGIAWRPVRPVALGAIAEYGRVQTGTRFDALDQWTLGVGIRARAGSRVSVDAAALGIGPDKLRRESLQPFRLTAGLTFDYSGALSMRVAALPDAQWSVGETVKLSDQVALAADLETSPLRLSVGLLAGVGPLGLGFLYRDHPELGGDVSLSVVIYM